MLMPKTQVTKAKDNAKAQPRRHGLRFTQYWKLEGRKQEKGWTWTPVFGSISRLRALEDAVGSPFERRMVDPSRFGVGGGRVELTHSRENQE